MTAVHARRVAMSRERKGCMSEKVFYLLPKIYPLRTPSSSSEDERKPFCRISRAAFERCEKRLHWRRPPFSVVIHSCSTTSAVPLWVPWNFSHPRGTVNAKSALRFLHLVKAYRCCQIEGTHATQPRRQSTRLLKSYSVTLWWNWRSVIFV